MMIMTIFEDSVCQWYEWDCCFTFCIESDDSEDDSDVCRHWKHVASILSDTDDVYGGSHCGCGENFSDVWS